MTTRFFKCNMCGNIVIREAADENAAMCCREEMEELIPNTVDAAREKHVPVVNFLDDDTLKVEVGSVEHPMTPAHHIALIYVATEDGKGIRVKLEETGKPEAEVKLQGKKPVAVYEYCNLHGLWMKEL